MDEFSQPILPFSVGLAANVFGVFSGCLMGELIKDQGITVAALVMICVALAILPLLNQQLMMRKKGSNDDKQSEAEKTALPIKPMPPLAPSSPLTLREKEVLQQILSGISSREIALKLNISEYTVKTHTTAILAKYNTTSRLKLVSLLLGQANEE